MEVPKINIPIKKYLQQVMHGVSRFQIFLTLAIIAGFVGMAVMNVEQLVNPEVDESAVNKQLSEVERVEFDEAAIQAIQQLNDSGIEINSDFVNSRDNPFFEN